MRRLAEQGVVVYAMAPDFDYSTRMQVESVGATPVDINFQRTGMNPLHDLWCAISLARKLARIQPDVVLTYFVKPVIYGILASWVVRIPHRVAMIEGLGYVFTPQLNRFFTIRHFGHEMLRFAVARMYRFSLACAHKVIFLNRDDSAEFVNDRLVDKRKVELLGGIGVDLDEWSCNSVQSEPVTFLLVARLLREKGIVEYICAARKIKSLHPNVRFLLLGALDTNPGALARDDVDSWVREGLVEWPGHVKVKPWLENASVFVLPSYREGVPRSTQEAMAMGRPIITTDAPGCRETVVEGLNGYLVPARNVEALVVAMTRFLDNPELITSMGLHSRRLAVDRFDARKVNSRIMNILGLP